MDPKRCLRRSEDPSEKKLRTSLYDEFARGSIGFESVRSFRTGYGMTHFISGIENQPAIVGVLHLLPLPGSPHFDGDVRRIGDRAVGDAGALIEGGVDAILLENFGDTPYFSERVPPETIAWMARVGGLVADKCDVPLGVCVLRNDGRAALAIAHSIGAQFIRICVLGSPRVTDQGLIEGHACEIVRDRQRLSADVKILADVDIKHSYPLAHGYSLRADAKDLVARSHADALIVTGPATGSSIVESDLSELRTVTDVPVFVGSGVTNENIGGFSNDVNGFIVGTSLKESKEPSARIDVDRVRAVVNRVRN